MIKVYGTNAEEYVQEKLGFVEDFAHGEVEVRIKETKSDDLRVASITYRLKGHPKPVHITTDESSSVQKTIDILADKVGEKISKDKDKYDARKRKKQRKVKEEQLKREEELAEEAVVDDFLDDVEDVLVEKPNG